MALMADERLAWLRQVPLFRGCTEASLASVAERTAEVDFAKGVSIVIQGQIGNGLFLIISGTAHVITGDQELARLGPGQVVGELGVIDQLPRVASVVALEPVRTLALASWDLFEVLDSDTHLARNLLIELAARIRAADARID